MLEVWEKIYDLTTISFILFFLFFLSRIQQLTQLYEETRSKLEGKEVELRLELEARRNREMQIKELEDTLTKETDRAQDLKVSRASFLGLYFFTKGYSKIALYSIEA